MMPWPKKRKPTSSRWTTRPPLGYTPDVSFFFFTEVSFVVSGFVVLFVCFITYFIYNKLLQMYGIHRKLLLLYSDYVIIMILRNEKLDREKKTQSNDLRMHNWTNRHAYFIMMMIKRVLFSVRERRLKRFCLRKCIAVFVMEKNATCIF